MTALRLEVRGIPAPKGSSRAMLRGGKAVNVPSGSDENRDRQRDWKRSVGDAALAAARSIGWQRAEGAPPLLPVGAVACAVVYRFPLLRAHMYPDGRVRAAAPLYLPTGKDPDKLNRASLDALTAAGCVWRDDAQASVSLAVRVFVPPGAWSGALVLVAACEHAWELVEEAQQHVVLVAEQLRAAKDAAVALGRRARAVRAAERASPPAA